MVSLRRFEPSEVLRTETPLARHHYEAAVRLSDEQPVGCHALADLAASAPLVGTIRLAGTVFIGTGAAKRGRISSMGIGKTIVEF
jgi:hypothetical protein